MRKVELKAKKISALHFNPAMQAFPPSRQGIVCKPPLRSLRSVGSVFSLQAKIEKLESFPLYTFRFQFVFLSLSVS